MTDLILVTGAAGGRQGSTGKRVTELLLKRNLPVRAFVHKLDERAAYLSQLGAEVIEGDLLDLSSVRKALQRVRRAYFTYPVAEGLLEAVLTFAIVAREAGTELVVNLSQLQNTEAVPSFRNLQHRLADQALNWADIGAVHLKAPPFYENLRALIAKTVIEQKAVFLPWGSGDAVFPLVGAGDVAEVAAALLGGPLRDGPHEYDLVGETPSVNEIVSTLSGVLGQSIRYIEISDERWIEAVRDRINPHALDHLSHLWRFFRTSGIHKGENGFHVTDATQKLLGKPPETLEKFFRANATVLGGTGKTSSAA